MVREFSPAPGSGGRIVRRGAAVVAVAALVSGSVVLGGLRERPAPGPVDAPAALAADAATPADAASDTAHALGPEALPHWRDALRDAFPEWSSERPPAGAETSPLFAERETPPAPETPPADEPARLAQTAPALVPLPMPRPPEFRRPPNAEPTRRAERPGSRRAEAAAAPAPVDDRNFFEKLFDVRKAPALAYAALEAPGLDPFPRRRPPPVAVDPAATAIYDISARTVTLPNGTRLEAHSGLGEHMDDPRNVHLKMRGATPPGTYDLTEREDLFHGVRAIRLTPVGGAAAVHGRVGLLAHTYMLGPAGASNGCISFRDYTAFLQAYLRGEVQRVVVVPGKGGDAPPSLATGTPAAPGRSARLGDAV